MTARFLNNLVAEAKRPDTWRLVQPLRYVTEATDDPGDLPSDLVGDISDDHDVSEIVIQVPAGYDSDMASIPRIFRPLIPGVGLTRWAAVIHDVLYDHRADRKLSDNIFYEALKVSGVGWLKRQAMYWGVRSGGWLAYVD